MERKFMKGERIVVERPTSKQEVYGLVLSNVMVEEEPMVIYTTDDYKEVKILTQKQAEALNPFPFAVGDRVIIRSLPDLVENYGMKETVDGGWFIPTTLQFVRGMEQYCATTMIVTHIHTEAVPPSFHARPLHSKQPALYGFTLDMIE